MKVIIIGTGYVGLVSGACFAEMGVEVTCVDIDAAKIESLRRGEIPIYEPGLEDLVIRNSAAGRLRFLISPADAKDAASAPAATVETYASAANAALPPAEGLLDDAEAVFIAVSTPPDEDGSADVSRVLEVARSIGRTMTQPILVVTKSTVPVGTSDRVRETIAAELVARGLMVEFDVASNPEFLKEGNAVEDFMHPDRVVVGIETESARRLMERLYKPFMINSYRMIFTDIRSAEMIKYAANAMLATRISFINDIANLCELVGADVNMVRKGIGTDPRIGSKFLYAGLGYGGSCFPKDVQALIHTAGEHGYRLELLEAVEKVNRRQKEVLTGKVRRVFGNDLRGRTFAVWGLAFKPETDDVRESAALLIIKQLTVAGATVRAYDPVAMENARRVLPKGTAGVSASATGAPNTSTSVPTGSVTYCNSMYEAVEGADALLLTTEWMGFRMPDWDTVRAAMRAHYIFDGRNIYDRSELTEKGFSYFGIGVPEKS